MHPELLPFFLGLAALLAIARAAGEICRKLKFPAVTGEILAGVLLGKTLLGRVAPGAFDWLFPSGAAANLLSGYTSVAVVLLLVVAGFEIDLSVVRKSGPVVFLTSGLGALIPFVLGFGTGFLLPDSDLADPTRRVVHAAFLGIALSISALPVIARTLLDLGLMKTEIGLVVLSSAVIDDLVGWTSFSVLSRQFVTSGEGSASIAASVVMSLAFVAVALIVVRPLADRVLKRLQPSPDVEPPMGRVLSLIMILAFIGASITQALGMHAVFGGFIMGLAIGDSKRLREHTRHVLQEFVTNVFTPVFFATMALRIDVVAAFDLRLVALVLLISCIAKVAGCAAGARLGGAGQREAVAIGFGMNSRGAMEILLAVLAMEAHIIKASLFVALVIMAIVTSMISGPALTRLLKPRSSPIAEMLKAGAIRLDDGAITREGVICALAQALAHTIDRPDEAAAFAKKVLEREELASTGVGVGVAFPHAEVEGLTKPLLSFARTETPIDFDSPDGLRVRLVFLLLSPPKEFEQELKLLAAMARLLTRPEIRAQLLEAKDEAAVLRAITDSDGAPGSLRAPEPARART